MVLELVDWMPWYQKIVQRLDLTKEEDQKATDFLSNLLTRDALALDEIRDKISGRVVIVFGAGPSLGNDLRALSDSSLLGKFCKITADGATTALLNIGHVVPDVIATDLDGRVEDQLKASYQGSAVVIHAHGDNIPSLRKYVPRFKNKVGSTQIEPRPHVYNFGGFTDGDRAAFLAVELGAGVLILAGMDFGATLGEYSKPKKHPSELKLAKLEIGLELLAWLSTRTIIPLYNLTERGVPIRGFTKIGVEDIKALL
jgi:uncharacterized Rossmann fold enzyme